MAYVKLASDHFAGIGTRVWSEDQEAIFNWFEKGSGNLAIRARAGCGKTTTLIEGVNRAPESRIRMAAFNKAIAAELQDRITNSRARAQTLHALGMSFCMQHISGCKVDTSHARARELAERAAREIAHGQKVRIEGSTVNDIAELHTKMREILVDPNEQLQVLKADPARSEELAAYVTKLQTFAISFIADAAEGEFWTLSKMVEAGLRAVALAKEPTTQIDFADMIFLPLVNKWAHPVCNLMVIDECQDMNQAQLRLALAVTSPWGRICICGDDKQAIYKFRGADSGSLDRLKQELHAAELGLKTTYRCAHAVVNLARAFVSDFQAADDNASGEVRELEGLEDVVKRARPGDFVLGRSNRDVVAACRSLIRQGRSAYVKGAEFAREALKLLDRLTRDGRVRCIDDLREALAVWGKQEQTRIKGKKHAPSVEAELLANTIDKADLLETFLDGATNIEDVRNRIKVTFTDTPKADAIMCSTVHKAKGLEAEQVFLLAKGFWREGEEANICYVAVTRAKSFLGLLGRTRAEFVNPLNPWENEDG